MAVAVATLQPAPSRPGGRWMEFELGQTYSGYKFLDVVTRSRGAVQYRVQNTLALRVESLHTLTGAAAEDPDATERFLRDVRIRARISHPHIVTFYKIGRASCRERV